MNGSDRAEAASPMVSPAGRSHLSLEGFHGSIKVPPASARPWLQHLAFAGPAVLVSAVAIHLLFPRISLLVGVIITAFDVLLLLSLQRFGMRLIETVILVLITTIGVCYFIEIFVLPQTQPSFHEMGSWLFAPNPSAFFRGKDLVYIAIGKLPLAMFPLMAFAASRRRMGEQRIGWFLMATGWASCLTITALDIYGLPDAMHDAIGVFTGR